VSQKERHDVNHPLNGDVNNFDCKGQLSTYGFPTLSSPVSPLELFIILYGRFLKIMHNLQNKYSLMTSPSINHLCSSTYYLFIYASLESQVLIAFHGFLSLSLSLSLLTVLMNSGLCTD
jgi:hypothetical protein